MSEDSDKVPSAVTADRELTFDGLVVVIGDVYQRMAAQAGRAVNVALTVRNWLIGCYIEEYERSGVDRARYGEDLLGELASVLSGQGLSNCNRRELYRYRRFYLAYPQIVGTVSPQLPAADTEAVLALGPFVGTASPLSSTAGQDLVERLSFSHFAELLKLDEELQRKFYEVECIRGGWSVRELRRQIASLYYERSGLSENKDKLAELVQSAAEASRPELAVRDPYVFEFLGLKSREVMSESDLEDLLLDKLQDFLLELGRGFCFEARQKRVLIGDTYYFVDLVFYHRVLKCHVLIELKVDEFRHDHLGQLNTYVSWYARNECTGGDNPPVGILLCTQKDRALMEYALAGMDNQLFVSRYQLALPGKEEIQRFVERQMAEALPADPADRAGHDAKDRGGSGIS